MDGNLKSPLKDDPLNNPGESLDREITRIVYDEVFPYLLFAGFLLLAAALEWWKWYKSFPPQPWLYTALAVVFVVTAFVKVRSGHARAVRLRQGRDGEKAVGQFLERLREDGATLFHDIPGQGFNLDHVVFHETGVYVIETKTWSKPIKGEAKIKYDGERITLPKRKPDEKPVIQVRAGSSWLGELLLESTGRRFPVQPVVVFPGWYVESVGRGKSSDVWVLNPKALPAYINNADQQLSPEAVKLGSYHLSRYVRTTGHGDLL